MATLAKAQRCGPDFDRWWSRRGRWVEAPNLRRSGESGVERITDGQRLLYCKRQQGHLYRSLGLWLIRIFPPPRPLHA